MLSPTPKVVDHSFCNHLSPQNLTILEALAQIVRFRQGQFLLQEGQSAEHLYLIHTGEVALQMHTPDRGPVTIGKLGPGGVLGWSWMFEPYRWHLDALALQPVECFAVDARRLLEHCQHEPRLGYEILSKITQVLFDRLQAARLQIIEFYRENC